MDVPIEMPDIIHVARVRHVGAYEEIGPWFDRLFRWADSIGVPTDRVLTLSWDNPEAVAPEKMRLDACAESPASRSGLAGKKARRHSGWSECGMRCRWTGVAP